MRPFRALLIAVFVAAVIAGPFVIKALQPSVPMEMQRVTYSSCETEVTKNKITDNRLDSNAHLVVAAGKVVTASDRTSAHYRLARYTSNYTDDITNTRKTYVNGPGTSGSEFPIQITGGQMPPDDRDYYNERSSNTVVLHLRVSPSLVMTCSAPKS